MLVVISNPALTLFMTYHWVCNKSDMTGATEMWIRNWYPSGVPEFTPLFLVRFRLLNL